MDSQLPIPGLGQLDAKETSSIPNVIAGDPSANGTGADTEMTDSNPVQSDTRTTTVEEKQAAGEEQQAGYVLANDAKSEVHAHATIQPLQPQGEASQDRGGDVKMQGSNIEEINSAVEVDVTAGNPQDQSTADVASQKQQPSEQHSLPASPRVTDALEAALDGLLGPAEDTAPKETPQQDPVLIITTPTNGEHEQHQASNIAAHPDVVPTSRTVPAEDEADANPNANPEWEADSSPYASSSSDSSDDSSDDDSDVKESKLGIEETARLLMEADGGSDDEMDGVRAAKQAAGVRTKNEQPDEPEPRPEIKIDPNDTISPLGIVQHLVEGTQVVIEALRDGAAVTILDRGTVLCKEDRSVLGVVHDTIATVHRPMYVLKFRSDEDAKEAALVRGTQIWYPKAHAKFVFPSQLKQEKGSDASNLHDEEVGPEEMEYSDDEQEQAHKRQKKNRKRGKGKFNKGDDLESRAPTAANGDGNLRYDDDEDGPYKPLPRPPNFGMGLPPPPPPSVSGFPVVHSPRGGQHSQNRRGGDFRGRGGRGRGFNGRGRGGHGYNNNNNSSSNSNSTSNSNSNHQLPTPPQNNHQPPPPFGTNPLPPMPGQWPFPIPPLPQFHGGGAGAPPNPGAPNPGFPMPNWGAAQPNPFPFPPAPPVPNWPNTAAQRPPPQQASYSPPTAGGYSMPAQYAPPPHHGAANVPPAPPPNPNNYQYPPNYYGGGQAPSGQSQQRWG